MSIILKVFLFNYLFSPEDFIYSQE